MRLSLLTSLGKTSLATLGCILALSSTADAAVQIGTLYYDIDTAAKTATVAKDDSYATMTSVAIPDSVTYEGASYPVTSIGEQAFYNCKTIKELTLPSTLQSVGKWSFYYCTGLTSITLPDAVTYVGYGAFSRCINATTLTLSKNLKVIDETGFSRCSYLTKVELPEGLTEIRAGGFDQCSKLASITWPSTLKTLGTGAFYGCGFTELTLPTGIDSFAGGMFSNNTKLTKITVPEGFTSLPDQTFYKCGKVTSITLPSSLREIGNACFYENKLLTSITLPEGLTYMGTNVFYGCAALKSIDLPAGITEIPRGTFYGCSALATFPATDRINSIGESAFYLCTSLKNVTLPKNLKVLEANTFNECTALESVTLPTGLTAIGNQAFWGNTSLTGIEIPASVKTIGSNPFIGCTSLTGIVVSEDNTEYVDDDGVLMDKACTRIISFPGAKSSYKMLSTVKSVDDYAFNNLPGVTDITMSPNVEYVGTSAFYNTGIQSLTFGTKLKSIGMAAFLMCPNLKALTFEGSDFTTGNNALSMTGITQLLLPEEVKTFGYTPTDGYITPLASCSALTTVSLPSTLTNLSTFGSGSRSLTCIYSHAAVAPSMGNAENLAVTLATECTVKIPKGSLASYESAWGPLMKNIKFEEALPAAPKAEASMGNSAIKWELFKEEGYPAAIDSLVIDLYLVSAGQSYYMRSVNVTIPEQAGEVTTQTGSCYDWNLAVMRGYNSKHQTVYRQEVTLSLSSSIDEITNPSDDTEAKYFDLNGRSIDAPTAHGIYIRLKGGKAEKVIL